MTTLPPLVLAIEDEPQVRRLLRAALPPQGFRLVEAATAAVGLREAEEQVPDVVLLDLALPDSDGMDVIRQLRAWSRVPIIVVSVRSSEAEKVRALEAGADDYLTKPFGVDELLARMRVALRHAARAEQLPDAAFTVGQLRVDLAARRVFLGDREVKLTRTEYQLLAMLVRHAGKVITHRQLLTEVWGPNAGDKGGYLRVYMRHLRHKLETDPASPRYLLTEIGVGYRMAAD